MFTQKCDNNKKMKSCLELLALILLFNKVLCRYEQREKPAEYWKQTTIFLNGSLKNAKTLTGVHLESGKTRTGCAVA